MWIQWTILTLFGLSLGMVPVVGAGIYFRTCKEPHAHMLLWSSITALFPPILTDLSKVILSKAGELSVFQAALPSLIISLVGSVAYLVFGIGFILLVKKITKHNQNLDPIVTTPVDEVEAQPTQGHV